MILGLDKNKPIQEALIIDLDKLCEEENISIMTVLEYPEIEN